ncbi:ribosome maturation factor RimP [Cloacibacillus sp. An23]|uniref:ribosome maturation factor RimP n=1 Tax=Cloacibacillus sp. An23 TaxID=1965591 RepID=UPI00130210B7|nr:ribosome maturation factor RimP [Cloacibacillus sp. An23]
MNQEKYNEIHRAICGRVEALGYECAGFEAVSENGMNVVRVYLEMPGGIDTGDCEIVSRDVGEYLDTVEEYLPDRYFLEISSPGVERPLFVIEDYRRFAGNEAEISLKKGGRKVRGVIAGTPSDAEVTVGTKDGGVTVALADIKRAHLVYVPERGQKKTFKKIPKKKK